MSKLKKLLIVVFMFGLVLGIKPNVLMNVEAATSYSYNSDDFYIENGVLKGYWGSDENVIIPDGITAIGDYAFSSNDDITSIKIPNSVTKIGNGAFDGCTNLTSITIPDSVTSVGNHAFSNCRRLKTIKFSNKMKRISDYMFRNCISLTSITIPSNITTIGSYAFGDCSQLSKINIPESVTVIKNSAFNSCTSLKSITLPSKIKVIDEFVFSECTNLTSVKLPANLTTIKDCAFYECNNLKSLTIPKSVTYISGIAYPFYKHEDDFKLYVTKGSYAEKFAKDKDIKYSYTTSSTSTKPSTVTGLKQSSNTTSSIKLSWNKASNATGYQVYRATSKTGTYVKVKTISSSSTVNYTNTGLSSGKVYYYKVRAVKGSTNGLFSSIATTSTKCKTPVVTLSSPKTKTIKVSWNKVTGATGYKVYRATSKNGSYKLVKTITSGSTVSYTNSGLTKGKTYYYKVKVYKTVNSKAVDSSYSTIKYMECK